MEPLLTTNEIAPIIRRKPQTVQKMARTGKIPSIGGGKGFRLLFDKRAVLASMKR